ncbi:conserved Plasmodium protein, unknown function [Plasmodium knowlesi strain H]|uniref:Uncharacterized protein n=3 Tax=Plasmodium knowlesi TaxID=5850 RepID=A0A5K1UN71_PLAKH|nr:conserved Plasmodium protein, unknown function [Plasmodium knowlesi strain H]OTN65184.1 Uncharacterized protein PKNOH_S120151200 [Plasmodium knowlesi]CAA9988369.1 conserved Plasmodium protein, unknown function [Plasmodium knowlesi strain H]SBO20024.1 conserved Plasmodium protein, unknown function [Plasmodium knowlesi strain H]SBO20330.1 conserved Plasmodium protein, unknown function [Plasmodium knowlesi strain H]VVS77843.1 conserved Plasmodium protein, unknown function [Plasmodium knowlesi |eukprot:XP_002259350.1 hypothetical protein, conserved in Plasmodium species [Plasmodium knowlesi strain H]
MLKKTLDENTGACNHPPQKARSKSVSIFSFFKKKKKKKNNSNGSVISTSNDSFELTLGEGNRKERNGKGLRKKQNMMDEESVIEDGKAKCKDNGANTTHSEYTQNYNQYQVMKDSHEKKKRESFFQKINILQKFKNYKKKNATSTFHAGPNASSVSADDEDSEEETRNLSKKESNSHVDYTRMYTNLKKNKGYNIKGEINSLKHKAQMLRNSIYSNGKKKADKGKLIHKNVNCSSEIILQADERDSSSCEANSLLTNFKMKSSKLKFDEEDSVEQMGKWGRTQKVEREYIFDRSSDVEVWDEGALSDQVKYVQGNNIDEQEGFNSNNNVIDFNEYAYEGKREDEAYLAERSGVESVTDERKVVRIIGARGEHLEQDERNDCHKGGANMDRNVCHTEREPKRTSEFSFSGNNIELVRKVQSNINDNVRTINNYVLYSNHMGGANLEGHSRTEVTTTQEGEILTSKEIVTTTHYDKHTVNEDIQKGCNISKGHNDDHHAQGKNALECILINKEENLAQKEMIIKLMYNNNGIYFNKDENEAIGIPSRRAKTAKVPSYDKVNSLPYDSKSVNVSRNGSTQLHPIRQKITYEKVMDQTNGKDKFASVCNEGTHKILSSPRDSRGHYWGGKSQGSVPRRDTHCLGNLQEKRNNGNAKEEKEEKTHQNGTINGKMEGGKKDNIINKYLIDPLYNLFVHPKEETDDPPFQHNKVNLLPPQGGKTYTNELQKTYKALYDIYDASYAHGVQYKAHPNTDGRMNVMHRAFNRNMGGNTEVGSSIENRGITLNNKIDGSKIYMCPLNRSKSMNKENASPFEHIQKEASNLRVQNIQHGYLNKASLYDTHFNTFHLKGERREPTFKGRDNGNFLNMNGIANCYNGPIKNMYSHLDHKFVRGSYYPRQECLASKFMGRSYTFCKESQGCSGFPLGRQLIGLMKKSCTFHGYQKGAHEDAQPRGYSGFPHTISPMMSPTVKGVENPMTIPIATPKVHTLHNYRTYCPNVGEQSHPRWNQECIVNNGENNLAQNGNPVKCPQWNPTNVGTSLSNKGIANNWRQNSRNIRHAEQVNRGGPYAQNTKQMPSQNIRNCTPFQCMIYGEGRPNGSRNDYMSSNFYTPVDRLKNENLRRLQSYSSKSKAPMCLSKSQGHGAIQSNMLDGDNNGGVMKRAKSLNPARSSSAHPCELDIYQECYVQNEEAHEFLNKNTNDNNVGGDHNCMQSHRIEDISPRDANRSSDSCVSGKKNLAHDWIKPPSIAHNSSVNIRGNLSRGDSQLRENKQTFFRSNTSNELIRENYAVEGPTFEGKDKMNHPPGSHSNNDEDIEVYAVSLEQDGENSVFEVDHENGEVVNLDKDLYENFTNEEETHQRNDSSGHQSSTEKVVSCDGKWDTPSVYFPYEGEEPLWTAHNPNVENSPSEDEYNCENGTSSSCSDFISEKRPEKVNHHPICTVVRHNFRTQEGMESRESLQSSVDNYLHNYLIHSEQKKILNGKGKDTKWTHACDEKKNDSVSYARTKCDGGSKTELSLYKETYNSKERDMKLKKLTNKKNSQSGKVNPNSAKSKILPNGRRAYEEKKKKEGVVKKGNSALATSLKKKKKDPLSGTANESKVIRQVTPTRKAPPSISPSKRSKSKPTSKNTNRHHGSESTKHFNIVNTVEESVQVNYNMGGNKINYKKESIVSSSNSVCIVNKLEDEVMKMRTRKRVGQIKSKNKDSKVGEAYSSTSIQREDCNFVGSFSNSSVPLWSDCKFVGSFSSMSIKRENCSIEKRYAYSGEAPLHINGAPRIGSIPRRSASARDSVKKVKMIRKNRKHSEGKQGKKATGTSSTRVQIKKNETAEKKKKKKKKKNTCTERRNESAMGSVVDLAGTGEENSSIRREPLWGPKKDTEKGNTVNAFIKSNRMILQIESANSNSMSKENLNNEKGDSLNSESDDKYISRKTGMEQTSSKGIFYEQIKQMNYILSNKNNNNFLNRINLNHLIAIEKTFINRNVLINKNVITLSTRSTKEGKTKRGSSPHEGILYDNNFSIVYLEKDIIYLKKIFLKKILSILLSQASSFREIKITILLLYFFVSLEESRVISPSVYPLSLINSLIQKFNLKVRKKLKRVDEVEGAMPDTFAPAGVQSDTSKKGHYDCLYICDGKNYLCVNDNSLPGKTCKTKIKLNNLIGYYHYINLNRLTYYLERVSSACARAAK